MSKVTEVAPWERQYLDLLRDAVNSEDVRPTRTGTPCRTVTGRQIRVPLHTGSAPLPLSKRLNYVACFEELLWFLRGETHTSTLRSRIWDAWADDTGSLGPIYGAQWRNWGNAGSTYDQIKNLREALYHDPFSRRHVVSAWNVGALGKMALPPCHLMFMVDVGSDFGLSLTVIQRSADLPVGVPFNLLSYAALASLLAEEMARSQPWNNWHARELIWFGNNCHVYENQVSGVVEQLCREVPDAPKPTLHILNTHIPLLERLDKGWTQDNYFHVENYRPLPGIKFPVAV